MRSIIIFTFLWFGSLFGYADIPKVPSQMEFAGVKLKITEGARAEIQKQVNSLRASDKYFKIKLDRVNLYFPIIERVFKAENLPDDFKYLSIQESALIGDAVSSANAVGFWQFKDFTGREVCLRIDKQVDERMNIVSATRGAAKYMKTNNFYYKNWVYALMAYNTGRGGARKYVKEENYGASKMTINKKTHWYIKTFLAHKIAFQNEIGGKHTEGLFLQEYTKGSGETISKMASKFELDKDLLVYYNKWLKKGAVPTDKTYAVILPVRGKISDKKLKGKKNTNSNEPTVPVVIKKSSSKYAKYLKKGLENADVVYVSVNGIDGILAESGDNITSLAKKGGVLPSKFKKFNDLTEKNKVKSGKIYYLKAKKSKSKIAFHVLMPNENLWDVSQKYGLKLKKLKKYNKLKNTPPAGTVLWLSKKKPKQVNNFVVDIDPKYSNKTVEKEIVSPKEKKAAKVITKPKEKEEKPKKVISKPPVVSKKIEEKQEEITEKK